MVGNRFQYIKIVDLDEEASGPSGEGALMRTILKLSETPPPEWSEYFNQAWQQHIYMMKRRARVIGDWIEIICMPAELQHDHIPELNKVIAQTNAAYSSHAADQESRREAIENETARQKQQLSELKSKLKFD
jgi:hypothetical protein